MLSPSLSPSAPQAERTAATRALLIGAAAEVVRPTGFCRFLLSTHGESSPRLADNDTERYITSSRKAALFAAVYDEVEA